MTTAIILAGGLGTRLRSAVPELPKPMAPVNGRPFLAHLMDYWIGQGVERFVFSVGYKKDVILDHFGSNYQGTPLTYVVEDEPLGTGGGVVSAAQGMIAPFLVLNGDTFFEVALSDLQEFHSDRESSWTFALFQANEVDRYLGMDIKADGEIVSLKSGKANPGRLANGGVYLISPSVFSDLKFLHGQKLSLEEELLPLLFASGHKFFGLEFSGGFIDIGIPFDYHRAHEILPNDVNRDVVSE
jgi:D-glycero-alpha-D-manno-heptose 1-phosphate guanylyltransferase